MKNVMLALILVTMTACSAGDETQCSYCVSKNVKKSNCHCSEMNQKETCACHSGSECNCD